MAFIFTPSGIIAAATSRRDVENIFQRGEHPLGASPDFQFRVHRPTEGCFPGARLADDAAAVGKPPFRQKRGDRSVAGPADARPLRSPVDGVSPLIAMSEVPAVGIRDHATVPIQI